MWNIDLADEGDIRPHRTTLPFDLCDNKWVDDPTQISYHKS